MNLERANWALREGRDWHVAWFRESLAIIDRFTHQEGRSTNNRATFKGGTNLCHYIRCSALWGPGVIALHLLTLALVMVAAVFLPLKAFGVLGYLVVLATLLIGLGVVVVGITFAEWADDTFLGRRIGNWLENMLIQPARDVGRVVAGKLTFYNSEGVSFWSMVWTFIVTLKHQVCPLIDIKESK